MNRTFGILVLSLSALYGFVLDHDVMLVVILT